MKTAKLIQILGAGMDDALIEIAERLEMAVDGGIAHQTTGHNLEAAAGAAHAAARLVRVALAACPPNGNVP